MTRPPIAAAVSLALLAALPATAQQKGFVPVTDEMLQNPDPADWLSWRRTLNHWGYSPLDQITPENVHRLRLVWTRPLMRTGASGLTTSAPARFCGRLTSART